MDIEKVLTLVIAVLGAVASLRAYVTARDVRVKIQEVHFLFNSRFDQLITSEKYASHRMGIDEGVAMGIDKEKVAAAIAAQAIRLAQTLRSEKAKSHQTEVDEGVAIGREKNKEDVAKKTEDEMNNA
jgi:hypothetical protein